MRKTNLSNSKFVRVFQTWKIDENRNDGTIWTRSNPIFWNSFHFPLVFLCPLDPPMFFPLYMLWTYFAWFFQGLADSSPCLPSFFPYTKTEDRSNTHLETVKTRIDASKTVIEKFWWFHFRTVVCYLLPCLWLPCLWNLYLRHNDSFVRGCRLHVGSGSAFHIATSIRLRCWDPYCIPFRPFHRMHWRAIYNFKRDHCIPFDFIHAFRPRWAFSVAMFQFRRALFDRRISFL